MKIAIQQSATKGFDLISGLSGSEFEEQFKINGQPLAQVREYLRGAKARPIRRGNVKTNISWTATKEHASLHAAEEFLLEHHASIPTTGSLVCTAEGSGQAAYTLSDAVLQTHTGERIGVTTIHEYVFVGGDFARGTE